MKKSKRVLIVAASPRTDGNSTILALKAAEGINAAGGEADVAIIGKLRIEPCNACDVCREKPELGCVIKDDMQPLYQRIRDAQGIIFSTPIYWFNVSAQMKSFIDRTYAMREGNDYGFTGKDMATILTYADDDVFISGGINALRSFQDIFAYVRANLVGTVYGSADNAGDVQSNDELLQKAFDLGKKMVKKY